MGESRPGGEAPAEPGAEQPVTPGVAVTPGDVSDAGATRPSGTSRRSLLAAVGAAAVAGGAGWVLRGTTLGGSDGDPAPAPSTPAPAPASDGVPGITAPAVPQRHLRTSVIALPGTTAADVLAVGRAVAAVPLEPTPDAGEVTVTIGVAPAVARELWPDRAALAADLPAFAGDVADLVTGGDLLLQVCAETAAAVNDATAAVLAAAGGTLVWERTGYRDAPTPEGTARTSTGFIDGIINPRTAELQNAGVWIDAEHRDTFVVVRRMTIDAEFLAAGRSEQEEAIGRRRDSGAPLSGGETMDEVDLFSKAPDGQPLTPVGAHARRAHPVNIGRPLMLRRSYGFDLERGAGLLFVAFLNDPETFVATQRRLDELDELIRHTTTDASGCFFVPEPAAWA